MKMSDVFVGEVEQKGSWVSDVNFDYLITHHDEKIAKYAAHAINVHDANQETITKQAERIKELEDKNTDLLQSLYEIQSECIGELAMGYKVDAQGIGSRISIVTGLTNPELLQLLERLR